MKAFLCTAALLVVIPIVGTSSAGGPPILKDPGTFTCDKWTGLRDQGHDLFTESIVAWTQGYFAGGADLALELARGDETLRDGAARTQHMLGAEEIPGWLDAYCRAYPSASVRAATRVLLRQAFLPAP